MEPAPKQDEAVNMTRAMEALSPWLKHPRKTIIQVEVLVVVAAALLLFQLILGSFRRRWHNSFLKYGLQVCNGIMFPLTVYTLGTMQSSPVKNSAYPVWAGFLIMASAGTTAVRQYDFYGSSYYKKFIQVYSEFLRDYFYVSMFLLLISPNPNILKTAIDLFHHLKMHMKSARASSQCVATLVIVLFFTKFGESLFSVYHEYIIRKGRSLFVEKNKSHHTRVAQTETREETTTTANDHANDSDCNPQSMKGYKYAVCYPLLKKNAVCYLLSRGGGGLITIDQIWDSCGNSEHDDNALKDLCLSYALSQRLLRECYFGLVAYPETSRLDDREFVFKKLLPPAEEYFRRAFRVVEVELGFCYDYFFTKYWYNFELTLFFNPVPFIHLVSLLKVILILMVGVIAIRKSLVLETPNPIIEVPISEADYIITLLVLSIALLVELVQTAFYLASNWAQVSLACMLVEKCCYKPHAYIFRKIIGLLRCVIKISRQLRNKIDQHSVIFPPEQQPDPVEVSDAVKEVIAKSLRSAYANNPTIIEEATSVSNYHCEYSWAVNNLSQLEVILIWHIATEYCNAISFDPNNGNGTTPSSNHRGGHLFGYVLQWLRPDQDPRRNWIASDSHGGVAVHLSRYYAYLIGSVPELLPYHEIDIAKLAQEVMEERKEIFTSSSYGLPEIYDKLKNLSGTQEKEDDPTTMFKKGLKLGKQLEGKPDRWEVLQDFWAKKIIHAAASHYTSKQHIQHLENGGEFLTHIWALLAHAGILSQNRNKDQEGQADLESGPSVAA